METRCSFWLAFCVLVLLPAASEQCAQQYRRELRYLDFYLGIQPTPNDGQLPVNEKKISSYIHNARDLDCDFKQPCAWDNAETDDLLDTSDFYLFEKTDKKTFPVQVRPGTPDPNEGTRFLLAGNTTQNAQSAVLVSSPIACQVSKGKLRFKYWLYNAAKVEVIVLKINPSRGHLQVKQRPRLDCHFLKPTGDECVVEIEEMHEPFKIGIRAFQLHDVSVGSMALITDIQYEAQICRENEVPSLFGGIPLSASEPFADEISTGADLNCATKVSSCLWSPSYPTDNPDRVSLRSLWQMGTNMRFWNEFIFEKSQPTDDFIFQYIDPMSTPPIGQLRSAIIPCTQSASSLSLRYWMSPNVQAQLCTVNSANVSLSCVFLSELNSPGPVMIDMDRGDRTPFRFVIEVIKFDQSRASVFAIDDIKFTGRLCHEEPPKTTPVPLGIGTLFDLQPFPEVEAVDVQIQHLDCNFEVEQCSHWEQEENRNGFQSGFVPAKLPFRMPKVMRGNAAVAYFTEAGSYAILQSPVISCADNARISVTYFSSLGARLSVCADDRCLKEKERVESSEEVEGLQSFGHAGELSVNVTSAKNFQLRVVAESVNEDDSSFAESFVIVKRITSEGQMCHLKDKTELACETLFCDFKNGSLCEYKSALTTPDDVPFEQDPRHGITATLSGAGHRRVVLRSPEFRLSRLAELRFSLSLSAFGSVAYICPDELVDNLVEDCELLLGPRIDQRKLETLQVQLDPEIQHFAIIAFHDKHQQFGESQVVISDIELVDADGHSLCEHP